MSPCFCVPVGMGFWHASLRCQSWVWKSHNVDKVHRRVGPDVPHEEEAVSNREPRGISGTTQGKGRGEIQESTRPAGEEAYTGHLSWCPGRVDNSTRQVLQVRDVQKQSKG